MGYIVTLIGLGLVVETDSEFSCMKIWELEEGWLNTRAHQ